jgi:hypothetical protein
MEADFFIGLDLGQAQDYSAVAVLGRSQKDEDAPLVYRLRHLERPKLGVPYPVVVERVQEIISRLENAVLIVDATGCGRPVVDLFKQANLDPVAVQIHGGDTATHEGNNWRVPKRDLVGVLQILLQTERLKIAGKLKLAPTLQAEMQNFKVKINPETAHDSYSAWRESDHDDLVLAVALAAWYGEREPPHRIIELVSISCKSRWPKHIKSYSGYDDAF